MGELIDAKLNNSNKIQNNRKDFNRVFSEFFKDGLAKTFFSKNELSKMFSDTGKYINNSFEENGNPKIQNE